MSGARASLTLLSGAALQAAALRIEDLEEEREGAVVLKVDREGAPRTTDPSNLPQLLVIKILPVGTTSISTPEQHSRRRPSVSKTLKKSVEALSYSKWIARAPLAQQTRAISPQPWVMKILPVGTASISAPVAGALQSACCSQSSRGPLGGITSEKNRGKWIQELGGIGAHRTNSREESTA